MKTVFVLGAGFSKEAGAPMQAEIMGEIFKIHQEDSNYFNGSDFQLLKTYLLNNYIINVSNLKMFRLKICSLL
ncbi:hypothetical protein [Klebsiella variicola]|uniref:hypothetical protein n=1 Tax=Klebsiella variicola TaxID=244366 RepID=UPI003750CDE3